MFLKVMCSPFWPNESVHSSEYGHFIATFVDTTPKPDWEMTTLQAAETNRVSSTEICILCYAMKLIIMGYDIYMFQHTV